MCQVAKNKNFNSCHFANSGLVYMFRVPHPDLISAFLPPPMPRHLTSMPGHRAPDTGHAMVVASGAGSSPASGGWESRFSHTKPRSTRRKKPTARIFVPSWLRVSLIESANPVQLESRHFRIPGPQTPDTGPARVVASGAAGGGSGEPGVPQGINKIRIYHSTHLPLRLCGFARGFFSFAEEGLAQRRKDAKGRLGQWVDLHVLMLF